MAPPSKKKSVRLEKSKNANSEKKRKLMQISLNQQNCSYSQSSQVTSTKLPSLKQTSQDTTPERSSQIQSSLDTTPEQSSQKQPRQDTTPERSSQKPSSLQTPRNQSSQQTTPKRPRLKQPLKVYPPAKSIETLYKEANKKYTDDGALCVEYSSPTTRRQNMTYITKSKQEVPLPEGRRIFTVQSIENAMNKAASHRGKPCTDAQFDIVNEKRDGLLTKCLVKCKVCESEFQIGNDEGKKTLPINETTTWGIYAAAINFTAFETCMSIIDVPGLSRTSYTKKETKTFHAEAEASLFDMLMKNGKEEAALAVEAGQTERVKVGDEWKNIPYTDVYGDGQWSKRCYNQTGTALSGSGCLIGLLSKKLLWVAVRNKFCYICKKEEKQKIIIPHTCFKNWSGSSSAMEADIISEGFKRSLEMHGIIYKRFVGDGDSSVYNAIKTTYNNGQTNYIQVEKLNCKNHAIRRVNFALFQILKITTIPVSLRKLLEKNIGVLGKSIQYLIAHSRERVPQCNADTLKQDILNIPYHAFGEHSKCNSYYCNPITNKLEIPTVYKQDKVTKPVKKQDCDTETNRVPQLEKSAFWDLINKIFERVANLSISLMHNITTNIAESFMSQVNKATGGRRVNFSHRGGYNRRVATSALAFQSGRGWPADMYRSTYQKSPGMLWKRIKTVGLKERSKNAAKPKVCRKLKFRKELKERKDEFYSKRRSLLAHGSMHYGQQVNEPDKDEAALQLQIEDFITSKNITIEDQIRIQNLTMRQFDNEEYKRRKKEMITATYAHKIYHMKNSTPNVSVLDDILEPPDLNNVESIAHGRRYEARARAKYAKEMNVRVDECGLFISLESGVLGASPDGTVGDVGILEIKCPFIERLGLPEDVALRRKDKFLKLLNGNIQLNRSHKYYYQVVMQLHVTNREWCDFVVFTPGSDDKDHIFVERIFRDHATLMMWNEIQKKLITFFREDLAPEILDPRFDRQMGYRQPPYRLNAMQALKDRKQKTAEEKLLHDLKNVQHTRQKTDKVSATNCENTTKISTSVAKRQSSAASSKHCIKKAKTAITTDLTTMKKLRKQPSTATKPSPASCPLRKSTRLANKKS